MTRTSIVACYEQGDQLQRASSDGCDRREKAQAQEQALDRESETDQRKYCGLDDLEAAV